MTRCLRFVPCVLATLSFALLLALPPAQSATPPYGGGEDPEEEGVRTCILASMPPVPRPPTCASGTCPDKTVRRPDDPCILSFESGCYRTSALDATGERTYSWTVLHLPSGCYCGDPVNYVPSPITRLQCD